jgi:hypothetical protein
VTSVPERPAVSSKRKRRANGEGTVFWDPRRRWIAEVSTVDPTGKPKRVARSSKSQAEARRLLKQLRRLADEGLLTSGRPSPSSWPSGWRASGTPCGPAPLPGTSRSSGSGSSRSWAGSGSTG